MSLSFEKKCRLLKRSDFAQISKLATQFSFSKFILLIKKSTHNHARLGITVSKKFGCAVKRNRFKRLVRENFRCYFKKHQGLDLLIKARPKAELPSHEEIKSALTSSIGSFESPIVE